jgi:HEAT repeat protein
MEAIAKELVGLGPDGIGQIAGMLVEPGKGDDVKARYALHGMAIYVSRPGAGTEREMYGRAVAASLKGVGSSAVKGFLARQLRLAGGEEAVGALGKLLLDDELCVDASHALLTIAKVGEADSHQKAAGEFRRALGRVKGASSGKSRLMVIQALGELRDRKSVRALVRTAADADRDVRLAACEALANIGDPRASEALRKAAGAKSPYEKAKATDALLVYAGRLVEAGNVDEAEQIYRDLWGKSPGAGEALSLSHVRCAALAGLARAVGGRAMGVLRAAMKSDDIDVRAAAAEAAVSTPGESITRGWMAETESDEASVRVGALHVLRKRRDPVALPAVVAAMRDGEESVRLAAVDAAASLGGHEAVPPLVTFLDKANETERKAARAALERIPGDEASRAIAGLMSDAEPDARCILLGVLAARGARAHLDSILDHVGDDDEAVRAAALQAVGALADEKSMPLLVGTLLRAKDGPELAAAEKATAAVCARAVDAVAKEACAGPVLDALTGASTPARCALLRVLGRIGDAGSLSAVRAAAGDGSAEVKDVAVRVLTGWPDPSAADALLAIAQSSPSITHRVLALRGCARLLGLGGAGMAERRLAMYGDALAAAARPEEKKLVLSGLADMPHPGALELAESCVGKPEIEAEAVAAIVKIARAISGAHREEATSALEKIVRTSRNQNARKQAKEAIEFIQRYEAYVTSWMLAGPYIGGELFKKAFPPEKPAASPEARKVKWRLWTGKGDRPWLVNFRSIEGLGGENRAVYLRAGVFSPARQGGRLDIGSDDGVKAWLNGKLVHANDVSRGLQEGQDKVKVTFEEGWNTLLLKITQGGGDWSAAARVRAAGGSKLEGLRIKAE